MTLKTPWSAHEIHPETPPDGILLSERFKGHDVSGIFDHLRQRGKEFGIVFGDRILLSNSRLALEACEYARDTGKYKRFHEHMFHAYFNEAMDIGSWSDVFNCRRCGLDAADMMNALKDGRYRSRLMKQEKKGKRST